MEFTHGDVRGCNIVVGNDGQALLSGFFRSEVPMNVPIGDLIRVDNLQWQSPELCYGPGGRVAGASDVYAYAITIYEAS
jgi:hypothetical protein